MGSRAAERVKRLHQIQNAHLFLRGERFYVYSPTRDQASQPNINPDAFHKGKFQVSEWSVKNEENGMYFPQTEVVSSNLWFNPFPIEHCKCFTC